jgi:spore maturation protein SpmA
VLNYIWLGLVLAAVVIGGVNDSLKDVVSKTFEMAGYAVMNTALPLVGIMALWLGVMRVAERAGLVTLLARGLRPVLTRLFPDVPPEHPAMGSMLMNLAANMLGLGNAATPLGLRAMKDLESLNPRPGTATNAMCTLLALNTSSVQLIPATAIAILAANGSSNPTAIVATSLIATICAAISAVAMAKFLERLALFRLAPADAPQSKTQETAAKEPAGKPLVVEASSLQPMPWWGAMLLAVFGLFFVWLFLRLAFPATMGLPVASDVARQTVFARIMDAGSRLSIPFLLSAFPLYAALRRVKVYEEFVDGAKEGFEVAIRIIPYLVAILVAIGMFRASGGLDLLGRALGPAMDLVHFPKDLLPLVLMRPLSGSGSLGIFAELVKQFGADSLIARTGGTIYGSTETTFYVLAVYFGSVGIKRTRHALLAGLTADLVGVVVSVVVCKLVFG